MELSELKKLLNNVKNGNIDIEEALNSLKKMPYEDLGFAKIDTHRSLRKGFPEVIYCEGKSENQLKGIFEKLKKSPVILATRADKKVVEILSEIRKDFVYNELAKVIVIGTPLKPKNEKKIVVACAGTSDIPVAEEAAITAETMGNNVVRLTDVGVAGIHRLFHNKAILFEASVVIVIAGMEGALASIIGGLVSCPVIAVPTSIGYGASFNGIAPLLTMLNSCAPGVTVVNIDNGFGAGYSASLINRG